MTLTEALEWSRQNRGASLRRIKPTRGEWHGWIMCITSENPQFAELLDLFLTAHFGATT